MTSKALLSVDNPTEVKQALLFLYSYQTEDEQAVHNTIEQNGVGFNGVDAGICSDIARKVLEGRELTPGQLAVMVKILNKYSGQLRSGAFRSVNVPTVIASRSSSQINSVVAYMKKETIKGKGRLELNNKGGLQFTPNVYPSSQIKSLGFKKWDGKAWQQTISLVNKTVVDDIRKMFGEIEVSKEVEEKIAPPAPVALPKSVANHNTLFDFQKEAIQHAATARHSMISLAPGLGKTVTAIMAAKVVKADRILVISPKSLMRNWAKEIAKWTTAGKDDISMWYRDAVSVPTQWVIANYETVRERPQRKSKAAAVANSDSADILQTLLSDEPRTDTAPNKKKETVKARSQFKDVDWDVIIVDESVLIKNRKAGRTQAIKDLVSTTKAKHVWLLTGSPTTKNMSDMWAQLNILDSRRFSSFWKFAEKFCFVEQSQWGWEINGDRPGATDLFKKENTDIFFARTQDQVLDLPEFIFDDIEIEMDTKQEKHYTEMEDEFMTLLDEGKSLSAPNVLAQLIRCQQLASNPVLVDGKDVSPKWDAAIELLEFEKLPAIIWTAFIPTAKAMVEKIRSKGYRVEALTGETPDAKRQEIVDDFQAGKLDVIVAHPGVGKFGFTLTAAHTAIYLERTRMSDDYYQSLHRIRRIGTKESPHVIHLLSTCKDGKRGTIDHVIGELLNSRRQNSLDLTAGEIHSILEK